jgi:hypothetical protein
MNLVMNVLMILAAGGREARLGRCRRQLKGAMRTQDVDDNLPFRCSQLYQPNVLRYANRPHSLTDKFQGAGSHRAGVGN